MGNFSTCHPQLLWDRMGTTPPPPPAVGLSEPGPGPRGGPQCWGRGSDCVNWRKPFLMLVSTGAGGGGQRPLGGSRKDSWSRWP